MEENPERTCSRPWGSNSHHSRPQPLLGHCICANMDDYIVWYAYMACRHEICQTDMKELAKMQDLNTDLPIRVV